MKLAAIQMTSGIEVAANLATAARLLAQAAAAGACLALLPENFSFMGRREADKRAVSETFGSGPTQDFLAAQARQLGMMVIGGTLPLRVPAHAAAACHRSPSCPAGAPVPPESPAWDPSQRSRTRRACRPRDDP